MTNTCSLGNSCSFAHGSQEKRNIDDVSKFLLFSYLIEPFLAKIKIKLIKITKKGVFFYFD